MLTGRAWSRPWPADPLILALANPDPEILPEDAIAARPDAIIGTGRSDYPNQVNNVLCFPFIFRGALDCGATTINEEMKIAARQRHRRARPGRGARKRSRRPTRAQDLRFGREYLIPKPFDPRLITMVAPAVAQAAMDSRRGAPADRRSGRLPAEARHASSTAPAR